MPVSEVVTQFRNEGMTFIPSEQETYTQYLECISNIPEYHFMIDFHIKDLLVFGPEFQFINHELYKNGTLILQDKASCMPPLLLDPPEGSSVLDMCAAPGMKTNYLANIVGKNGHVYAVERDQERYLTLSKLMNNQKMKNVHCMRRDAIEVTGNELADVEYILVDPSCSGSGIINRVDYEQSHPDRIKRLAGFQVKILRHALTRFRNVKRVTYSTCSLNAEENEEVVRDTLKYAPEFQLVNLKEKLGSDWLHYGSEKYGDIGTCCLYTNPEIDLTNGFFVAVFERKPFDPKQRRRNRSHYTEQIFEKPQKNEEWTTEEQGDKIKSLENVLEDNSTETNEVQCEKKQRKYTDKIENDVSNAEQEITDISVRKKKKNKTKTIENILEDNTTKVNEIQCAISEEVTEKKKRKKNKDKIENDVTNTEQEIIDISVKKKKNNKTKAIENIHEDNITEANEIQCAISEVTEKKKRKKNKGEIEKDVSNIDHEDVNMCTNKKKEKDKNKNVSEENSIEINEIQSIVSNESKDKKKKRKKDKIEDDITGYDITEVLVKKKKKNKHRTEDISNVDEENN